MPQQTLNTPRETTHQRIAAALEAIEQNMSDEHEAVNIDYDNTYSGLSADNVQEAIDELNSEKANTADLGTAASKDVPTSGNATSTQVVMGNDSRLTNARPASDVSAWAKASTKPTYTASEVGAYTKTESDNKYVAKETGKGLSTNDYTTADKNKLAGIEAEANKTVVDSAMSDSSTNPLQNKVITKELEGAKTATGNPITVTDAAPVNAVNLSMDLEPIQDLHGYDHPWVGGAGKNKLPMTVDGIKSINTGGTWNGNVYTVNGVTFEIETDNDGNITNIKTQGTPTSRAQLSLVNGYILNTFKGMILNGANKDYSGNNGIYVGYSNDGNSWVGEDFQKKSDLIIRNYNYVHFDIMCSYGTFDDDFKPMIRLSTETDSSFAPYSNICPISGRSEVAINRVGKNWLQPQTTRNIKFGGSASTGYTLVQPTSTSLLMCGEVKVEGLQSIYLSGDLSALSNSTFRYTFTSEYPNVGVETFNSGAVGTNNAITVPSNAKWLVWGSGKTETQVSDEGGYTKLSNTAMINAGSTATTYEPYQGKTYTIQVGQDVYGGTLDVTRGKMVVDRGYKVYDGSSDESWNSDRVGYRVFVQIADIKSNTINVITNRYKYVTAGETYQGLSGFSIGMDILLIGCLGYSVADWKAYLANNPLQVCYELATPYTIDLTPQQIKLLENTNTLYTDYEGDTIIIEYQPNNAIGEAVRAVEESYDPEFAVRPVLKSMALNGTTNNVGIYQNIFLRNIVPIYFKDNYGYTFLFRGTNVLSFRVIDDSNGIKTNYNFSGNLYYYDLEG